MNTMIEIIEADKGTIYVLNGVAYDIHFPLEWAIHPKRFDDNYASCPSDCNNCLEYGSYNGVFIGYCLNCASAYGYKRGNGFVTYGVERSGDGMEEKNSVWNTYLKNVKLDEIGWNLRVEPVNGLSSEDDYLYDKEKQSNDDYKRFCKDNFGYDYHLNSPSENSKEDGWSTDVRDNHNYNYYDIEYFDDEGSPLTVQDLDLESQKEDHDFAPIHPHTNNHQDYYDIEYFNFNKQTSPLTVQELPSKRQEQKEENNIFEPTHPYLNNTNNNYDIEYFDHEGSPLTIQDLNLETQEEDDLSVEYIEL